MSRDDGELVWEFRPPGRGGKIDSSPVICGDKVVVGCDDGRLYMLRLDNGEQVWSYQIGEVITGSPAVAAGRVVIGAEDGLIYVFGPADAAQATEQTDGQ